MFIKNWVDNFTPPPHDARRPCMVYSETVRALNELNFMADHTAAQVPTLQFLWSSQTARLVSTIFFCDRGTFFAYFVRKSSWEYIWSFTKVESRNDFSLNLFPKYMYEGTKSFQFTKCCSSLEKNRPSTEKIETSALLFSRCCCWRLKTFFF